MDMRRSVILGLGGVLMIGVFVGFILFLRMRNAPEEDLVPVVTSAPRSAGGQAATNQGPSPTSGGRDNGYKAVPYEEIKSVPPPAGTTFVRGLPDGQPVGSSEGGYSQPNP